MDYKNIKNKFYPALTGVIIFCFLVIFSACSQNSKKSNYAQVPPPYLGVGQWPMTVSPGCTTCINPNQMGFLASTDSENIRGSLYVGLDYYGDMARGFDFNDPKIPTYYTGMVQAHGRLQIRNFDTDLCNAPVGDYEVFTANSGIWQYGVTGTALSGFGPANLRLEARSTNGSILVVTFVQGIIYNNISQNRTNKLEINRMGGTFLVEAVNGQLCRSLQGTALTLELL